MPSASEMGLTDQQVRDIAEYLKTLKAERKDHTRQVLTKAVLQYLRPSFHPDDRDNYHLAEAYLTQVGRLAG